MRASAVPRLLPPHLKLLSARCLPVSSTASAAVACFPRVPKSAREFGPRRTRKAWVQAPSHGLAVGERSQIPTIRLEVAQPGL